MDTTKLMKQTNERFLYMLAELIKDSSDNEKERFNNAENILQIFAAHFDDILTVSTSAAIFSYHEQLREALKHQGIDIGDFTVPEDV